VSILTTDTLTVMQCGECGITFAIPEGFRAEKQRNGTAWCCPSGHRRIYAETTEQKLRRELETAQRRLIYARNEAEAERTDREAAERSASAYKGQATRLRKRIGNGVCPVTDCRRHFANVERHIASQHPTDWAHEHPTETAQ